MTTAIRIWDAAATIASMRGGWVLPLLALFALYAAFFALLEMAGAEDDKFQSHPEILEQERKRALDAAFNAAHPKYMNPFIEKGSDHAAR